MEEPYSISKFLYQVKIVFTKETNPNEFSSGRIESKGNFSQKFEIFELRMKIVPPNWRHSAFWLQVNKFEEPTGSASDGAGFSIYLKSFKIIMFVL